MTAVGWAVAFGTMRPVSDAFLLNMAEVSATLIGLFLVGVFFYIETGLRRLDQSRKVFESYLRSGTRITLIVFAIPLGLSLALVALEPVHARILFAVLSPTREDLTWAIILSFAVGFISISATVMSAFDIARAQPGRQRPGSKADAE